MYIRAVYQYFWFYRLSSLLFGFFMMSLEIEISLFAAATDDTQRMMQMSGFGFDPSKVKLSVSACLFWFCQRWGAVHDWLLVLNKTEVTVSLLSVLVLPIASHPPLPFPIMYPRNWISFLSTERSSAVWMEQEEKKRKGKGRWVEKREERRHFFFLVLFIS